jgi:peptidyl-prolyl cis-trans isomerase B (cyclophilin B)
VSKASKRERQRLNREARREAELAWMKRRKRLKAVRNVGLLLLPLVALFIVLQVVRDDDSDSNANPLDNITCADVDAPAPKTPEVAGPPALEIDPALQYTAVLDTSCGEIEMALDSATAPTDVNNFVYLARQGYYDDTQFHRAAQDFVIQGGDPLGDGTGGPGYTIQGEVPPAGVGYEVGTVAMAKGGDEPAGTAASQFFVITNPPAEAGQGLDFLNQEPYQYALLGQVTRGLNVAQKIESFAPPEGDGTPTQVVVLRSVTITEGPAAETTTTAPAETTAATTAPAPPSS